MRSADRGAARLVQTDEAHVERWQAALPTIVVLVALVALATVPIVIRQLVEDRRLEIATVADPARGALTAIQLALARETAGMRGYLLTADPRYTAAFEDAYAMRERRLAELLPLARRLGPATWSGAELLVDRLRRLDAQREALFTGKVTPRQYTDRLDTQQEDFVAATAEAARLDVLISRTAAERQREIFVIQRAGGALTILLGLLALVGAVLVARLGRRTRMLAVRLDARARSEAALREIAGRLSAAISVREVVEIVTDQAVAMTQASGAWVERATVPQRGSEIEVVAVAGHGAPPPGTRIPYPGSLTEEAAEAGEPRIVVEPGAIGAAVAPYLRASCPTCSALVLPLVSEGQLLGALVLLRAGEQPSYTEEEAAHARVLGDLASAALRRVILLEEVEEERRARTLLLDSTDEGIYGIDMDDRITFLNRAGAEMLGYSTKEVLGWDAHALIHHSRPDGSPYPIAECPIHAALGSRQRMRIDTEVMWRRDGRAFPTEYSSSPVIVNGEVRGAVLVFSDITERKRAEAERELLLEREHQARVESEQRREALERVTESRTRLMRGFSHDVKNPLGAADGYAALLEEGVLGELSAKQRESVERIRRSIRTSLKLIADLLDLAKAESGQLELERMRVNLAAVAREVAEDFRAQARGRGLELDVHVPDTLVETTDPTRVRQVLANLASNAVKYASPGRVVITAERLRDGDAPRAGAWVALRVADSGPGIAAGNRESIFHEFTRFDPGAQHGVGIGLAISRRIAQALGGDLTLTSEVGTGSTFTLWLPQTTPA